MGVQRNCGVLSNGSREKGGKINWKRQKNCKNKKKSSNTKTYESDKSCQKTDVET